VTSDPHSFADLADEPFQNSEEDDATREVVERLIGKAGTDSVGARFDFDPNFTEQSDDKVNSSLSYLVIKSLEASAILDSVICQIQRFQAGTHQESYLFQTLETFKQDLQSQRETVLENAIRNLDLTATNVQQWLEQIKNTTD
jgi:hypothetical protein